MSPTIILIGVAVIVVLFFVVTYNKLVSLKINRENSFADIDVQLKIRHDLVLQLIDTVKGYMKHENEVLTKITEARNSASKANNVNDKIKAETQLQTALSGLNIAVEAYPDLKASQNFMQVQEEMADLENKLAASRRYFNSSTRELNTKTQVFPANMIAGMFGFKEQEFFNIGDAKREKMEEKLDINF